MFKPVARFITRLQGGNDGLFIGSIFKNAIHLFEPNTIYEMRHCELSGDLVIKKIGKGMVAESGQTINDSPIRVHWAQEFQDVTQGAKGYLFLTQDEMESLPKHQIEEN